MYWPQYTTISQVNLEHTKIQEHTCIHFINNQTLKDEISIIYLKVYKKPSFTCLQTYNYN
jgi:hypothetical protein